MNFKIVKSSLILKPKKIIISHNNYLLKFKNKKEIFITNQALIDKIILKKIFINLNPLINKTLDYLTNIEDDESETSRLYGLLAKEREIILKKYDEYLSNQAKDEYLKKIRFLVIELNKRIITYTVEKKPKTKK